MLSRCTVSNLLGGCHTDKYMDEKNTNINPTKASSSTSTISSRIEYELELLKRHVEMLKVIIENQPIGIIKLSYLSKFPQHKVRYSLRILEQEGLIEPSPDGAVTTKKCKSFLPKLHDLLTDMEKTIQGLRKSIKA